MRFQSRLFSGRVAQADAELTGNPALAEPRELPPLDDWLLSWIRSDARARDELDSFDGVFHHLTDAWNRRAEPNVMLVHYADLLHDLRGETHRIAVGPGIDVSDWRLDELVLAATFESMRSNGDRLAPDPAGVLLDTSRFFCSGRSGAGTDALSPVGLNAYDARAARVAPPELLAWLYRG